MKAPISSEILMCPLAHSADRGSLELAVLCINDIGTIIMRYTNGHGSPLVDVSCDETFKEFYMSTETFQEVFVPDVKCKNPLSAKDHLPAFTITLISDHDFVNMSGIVYAERKGTRTTHTVPLARGAGTLDTGPGVQAY